MRCDDGGAQFSARNSARNSLTIQFTFRRYCLVLAGPGVVAATYATGALANWLLMPTADGRYFNSSSSGGGSVDIVGLPGEALADGCAADAWTEMAGYVLGVIVSATDPVAVVALLREMGVKKSLATLIERRMPRLMRRK